MPNHRKLIPLLVALGVGMAACSSGDHPPAGAVQFTAHLEQMSHSIAGSTGYPNESIELTGSRFRLAVSIIDAKLASMDDAARTARVAGVVAAVENLLPTYPEFSELQAISIAIIHPSSPDASPKEWHTEDVLEYRRGPSQRFTIHIT